MLTQGDMEGLAATMEKAASKLEADIMKDIVRRIRANGDMTSSAEYQINRLRQMGKGDAYIKEQIQTFLRASDEEIERIYRDVAGNEYIKLSEMYSAAGKGQIPFGEHAAIQAAISAALAQSRGTFSNIAQTLGFTKIQNGRRAFTPLAEYYQRTLDEAVLGVATGAFSYQSALKKAVKEMTGSGLRTVSYASGRSLRIESAARMALMTGLGQITGYMNETVAEELGTDDYEVSYHIGARPDHQPWQGRVYSREELRSVCGLGTVTGLCGANCYHYYIPFMKGISVRNYTDAELDRMIAEENRTKPYQGKEYTTYQALQKQRDMELVMRKYRQDIALLKEGEGSEFDILAAQARYRTAMDSYVEFSQAMGLPQQRERAYMDGLGRVSISANRQRKIEKHLDAMYNKGNSTDNLKAYEQDIQIRKAIQSGRQPVQVEEGKQGKHIKGHNNYIPGRSYLTIPESEVQELVNKCAGTGEFQRTTSNKWKNKEVVTVDRNIGIYVDLNTGNEIETNRFVIHYSKKGVHIVPTRPKRS